MFSFAATTKTTPALEDEKKISLQQAEFIKTMTFTVPGMYKPASAGRNSKGRKSRIPRFPSPSQSNRPNAVFDIYKSAEFSAITASTSVDITGAFNFALAQVNDYTHLQLVFHEYRIAMVEVSFLPQVNQINTTGFSTGFTTAIDYADATAISIAALRDYPSAQTTEDYTKQVRTIIPRVAVAAYSGAFTSYMAVEAPWISTASPSVQHYGVKYGIRVAGAALVYNVFVRYHLQFRNTV
jgi:hypothetical protein